MSYMTMASVKIKPKEWIDKKTWREINDILKIQDFKWLGSRRVAGLRPNHNAVFCFKKCLTKIKNSVKVFRVS